MNTDGSKNDSSRSIENSEVYYIVQFSTKTRSYTEKKIAYLKNGCRHCFLFKKVCS